MRSKRSLWLAVFVGLGIAVGYAAGSLPPSAGEESGSGEVEEPPLLLRVDVDGSPIGAEVGKAFEIPTPRERTTIAVHVAPYRLLKYAGVEFRYPSSFTFEADVSTPKAQILTMEGPTTLLMVQLHVGRDDVDALREAVVTSTMAQYGEATTTRSPIEREFAGSPVTGARLEVQILGNSFVQEFFSFTVDRGTLILLVQDTLTEDGGESPDTQAAYALLEASLLLDR